MLYVGLPIETISLTLRAPHSCLSFFVPAYTKAAWLSILTKPKTRAYPSATLRYVCNNNNNDNKSAQSNLGRGPRRWESKSPLVTMARPKFVPKVPLPVDRSPKSTMCLIPGPVRPMMPNGTQIRSAVFPQCTGQTDAPTDRSSTGKFDDYRPLRL